MPGVQAMSDCQIHDYHRPEPQGHHRHHVIPLAWTRAVGEPESEVVNLCPTGHENVHRDLRAAIRGLPWRAGIRSSVLVHEALDFYGAHPEAQDSLRAMADELVP